MAKRRNIKLQEGKFYNVRDGSVKGHPGLIFKADYVNGEYDAIVTGTTKRSGTIPIHPTSKKVKRSHIRKNPFRGTRNDYGNEELLDIKFDNDAYRKAEIVKKNPYFYGHHYKKKHKIK